MKKLLTLIAFVALCVMSEAQMAKFQALYIFQFAKNVNWPVEDSDKPIVVTVVGDKVLSQELKGIVNGKNVGGRKISVNEAVTSSGLSKSDIVFLGESKSSQINQLVAAQSSNKVLIVSGTKGQCAQGAGIAFVADGGKLNFEIHEGNIHKNGLKVTSKLISLGKKID